jgi:membrane fusion protein (multidrug efflux system)
VTYARARYQARGATSRTAVAAGDVLFGIDPASMCSSPPRAQLAEARATRLRAEQDFPREGLFGKGVVSKAVSTSSAPSETGAAAEQARSYRRAAQSTSRTAARAPCWPDLAARWWTRQPGESGRHVSRHRRWIPSSFAPTERDRLDGVARRSRPHPAAPADDQSCSARPYPRHGVVDYVDPTIEATRGTITVRAVVPNPDGVLKPGEFVRAIAVFPERSDAVLIPERAVQEEQGGSFVLVVKPDDLVESRRVRIGLLHAGMREIVEGVAAGDRVIVDGVQKARPGQKVVVKQAGQAPPETKPDAQRP